MESELNVTSVNSFLIVIKCSKIPLGSSSETKSKIVRISEDEEILETGGKKYEKTILISVELFLSAFRRRIVSHRLDSSFLALTIRGCVELDKGKSF